jgi:hypothetical protein
MDKKKEIITICRLVLDVAVQMDSRLEYIDHANISNLLDIDIFISIF